MPPVYFSETFIDWILGRASGTDSWFALRLPPPNFNERDYGTVVLRPTEVAGHLVGGLTQQ